MIVFRLCKSKYAHDLSGKGAEKSGGRWNGKGYPMLYTSGSRSLCLIEIAVHLPLGILPDDFVLVSIEIPDSIVVKELLEFELPINWKSFPHQVGTSKLGNGFLKNADYLILKVPSAVVQDEFNFLINPEHELFHQVKISQIEPFYIDNRLFR
jgi:RES domain-containing protein